MDREGACPWKNFNTLWAKTSLKKKESFLLRGFSSTKYWKEILRFLKMEHKQRKYNENSGAPKIEPCGTPYDSGTSGT